MGKLLVHPQTERQLAAFIKQPSHAVSLVAPAGSGKGSLARELAAELLVISLDKLDDHPYVQRLAPKDGKAISIESIRELEHFLSLTVPGTSSINRVVIIEDAHTLTTEAQNALLKTLEEPPQRTVLILTTAHAQTLLPTIRSRSQSITVKNPDKTSSLSYFKALNYSDEQISRAYSIGGGLIGLVNALLRDEEHPLLAATQTARALLGQTTYERLLQVDALGKDRQQAIDVLFIMQQMAHLSLQSASGPAADKWQRILEASYETSQKLSNSAQPKLALTNLMLTL